MGFNTAVLILNDAIDGVEKDPASFAKNMMHAWHLFQRTGNPTDFAIGNHVNGGTIFHNAHADVTGVYAIGGNHTSKLHTAWNGGKHHSDEEKVKLLKELANELGYTITKKRKKKHQ